MDELAYAIIKACAKYGTKFSKWVWANKPQIMKWSSAGCTVAEIVLSASVRADPHLKPIRT
ncbi:aureocin A53 family class IId bacteriocin [Streptomyces sp. CAI-121]|uniref:aureocin A53 family class IId bacteriocin n=1 Tax=unclassified Streptomyces TaxID=2593676 RepID=UPI001587F754|nr:MULTISPECIES: aureocin A53 family class IId bacteriocin [unclassified Streptomyces]NUV67137.1 aureocin A53 family class IId bacteriocin [Streptomyces sp. CAI-121]NUW13255.1 aureocin A53 family class IId bacteriocin [Streptomyces sp. CAI-68]